VTDAERLIMASLIGRSSLEVGVRLGGVDVPARTIVDLHEGDTFVLDGRVGRALDVLIGGRTRFRGLPGISGSHVALQISEVVEEEQLGFVDRTTLHAGDLAQPLLSLSPAEPDDDTVSHE
jgi:flagellar motor switch protein FliM